MFISEGSQITRKEARYFLEPANATHRQYEALRAFFVEGLSAAQVAQRFGYSPGSVRVMVHKFRQTPERPFFRPPAKGPQAAPKSDPLRDRIVALRKQNLSIYDISRSLAQEGHPLSAVAVSQVLRQEGFARLPRRSEEERPPTVRPTVAAVADVRQLNLQPRTIRTQLGGLFLFVPLLAQIPLERICSQAKLPGSKMIPAGCALRSLLGLKLFGTARHGHVMSAVLDEGLALFAGLNVIPKRSFLTEYSCRIDPACYGRWMHRWFEAVSTLGLPRGTSFDLDFHTIPFQGEDALMEKHYVTKRSRRQKGILAFLARDDQTRVFCYANGQLRKDQQNDEILRFVAFWKQRTGRYPEELIFDSKLTTYANLSRLNGLGIRFITLRRRSSKLLREIATTPASAWRRIELEGVSRLYKTPRILDRQITLSGYEGPLRQVTILDLGHEEPTLLLTNQRSRSPAPLIERYARRMLIENQIADGIDFFHMDALSSAVAMKVNCDLQLTLMASSLYRLLGVRIGRGYETAKSRHLFRDFINATATIRLTDREIHVAFAKRAHNPLLLAAGLDQTTIAVPWLGNRRLKLAFG
jgi:transposase